MMKNTWNEEPEKRPLFTDIVKFIHEKVIEDTTMDDIDRATDDGEKDSSYLRIVVFQSQTTNDS